MVLRILAGLALALVIDSGALAQTCASVPYSFSNGETASASQVNANFACAALLGGANFTGNVGVNDSSPAALVSLGGAITTIKLAVYNGGGFQRLRHGREFR